MEQGVTLIVFGPLANYLELLEFFIRNPNEWFTIKDLRQHFTGDVGKLYSGTNVLRRYGFLVQDRNMLRRKRLKFDTNEKICMMISSLYIEMKKASEGSYRKTAYEL